MLQNLRPYSECNITKEREYFKRNSNTSLLVSSGLGLHNFKCGMSYEYLLIRTLETSYTIYPTNQDCKSAWRFGAHNAKYPPSILSRVTGGYFPWDNATGTWILPLTSICVVPRLTFHAVTHTLTSVVSWLVASFSTSAVAFALDSALNPDFIYLSFSQVFSPKFIGILSCHLILKVSSDFHDGIYCTYFYFSPLIIGD
jgi:hypothetical protein